MYLCDRCWGGFTDVGWTFRSDVLSPGFEQWSGLRPIHPSAQSRFPEPIMTWHLRPESTAISTARSDCQYWHWCYWRDNVVDARFVSPLFFVGIKPALAYGLRHFTYPVAQDRRKHHLRFSLHISYACARKI